MPIFSYETAHDIIHAESGGKSASCPLCNGKAEKKDAHTMAGEIIEKRGQGQGFRGPMSYISADGTEFGMDTLIDVMSFSEDGKMPEEIKLVPIGEWNTRKYGTVKVTASDIEEMASNFSKKYRAGIPIDIDHRQSPKYGSDAAGWIKTVTVKTDGLYGKPEWNKLGQELITDKIYKFLSPEFAPEYPDPLDKNKIIKNVFLATSLVNQPLFRQLPALSATEKDELTKNDTEIILLIERDKNTNLNTMDTKTLSAKTFSELTAEELRFLESHATELTDEKRKEFGIEPKPTTVQAGEGQVVISAAEHEATKKMAEEGAKAMKMLERNDVEKKVTELAFSEKGMKIKSDSKSKVVDFMVGLNEEQKKTFTEILEAIPEANVFGEVGHNKEVGSNDGGKALDEAARKIMADEKIPYEQALIKASEANPSLVSYAPVVK